VNVSVDCPDAAALAVLLLAPATVPSVSVALEFPLRSVVTCVEFDPPNLPPPAVTVNVTEIPGTPTPLESAAVTVKGFVSADPAVPVWLSPDAFVNVETVCVTLMD